MWFCHIEKNWPGMQIDRFIFHSTLSVQAGMLIRLRCCFLEKSPTLPIWDNKEHPNQILVGSFLYQKNMSTLFFAFYGIYVLKRIQKFTQINFFISLYAAQIYDKLYAILIKIFPSFFRAGCFPHVVLLRSDNIASLIYLPGSGTTMSNNTVDKHKLCCSRNIVAPCFQELINYRSNILHDN